MVKRFVSIWFCHFATDWFSLRQPQLKTIPFVLRTASHGKMIVTAVNAKAAAANVSQHMPLADARAFVPNLQVQDDQQERVQQVLKRLAEWCIRFTPMVSIDPPDGLFFDAARVHGDTIAQHAEYTGVRVTFNASLGTYGIYNEPHTFGIEGTIRF